MNCPRCGADRLPCALARTASGVVPSCGATLPEPDEVPLPLACELCAGDRLLCQAVRQGPGGCPFPRQAAMVERLNGTARALLDDITAEATRMMRPASEYERRPKYAEPDEPLAVERHTPSPERPPYREPAMQSHDVGQVLDAIGTELGDEWAARVGDMLGDDSPAFVLDDTAPRWRRATPEPEAWPINARTRALRAASERRSS